MNLILPRSFGNTHDGVHMQDDWVPMQDDWVTDWVRMQEGVLLPRTFGNMHDWVHMKNDWVPMKDDWVPMQKTEKATC